MEYKRLTGQEWSDDIDLKQELGYSYIYKRLHELEDKIEQGKMIELPCKVGDTVYVIFYTWNMDGDFTGSMEECKVNGFYIDEEYRIMVEDDVAYDYRALGVDVFLTREEAEKKLKELQGRNTIV